MWKQRAKTAEKKLKQFVVSLQEDLSPFYLNSRTTSAASADNLSVLDSLSDELAARNTSVGDSEEKAAPEPDVSFSPSRHWSGEPHEQASDWEAHEGENTTATSYAASEMSRHPETSCSFAHEPSGSSLHDSLNSSYRTSFDPSLLSHCGRELDFGAACDSIDLSCVDVPPACVPESQRASEQRPNYHTDSARSPQSGQEDANVRGSTNSDGTHQSRGHTAAGRQYCQTAEATAGHRCSSAASASASSIQLCHVTDRQDAERSQQEASRREASETEAVRLQMGRLASEAAAASMSLRAVATGKGGTGAGKKEGGDGSSSVVRTGCVGPDGAVSKFDALPVHVQQQTLALAAGPACDAYISYHSVLEELVTVRRCMSVCVYITHASRLSASAPC